MKYSKIEWCDHTVNFWWGCTKVSPACAACYALAMARIFAAKKCQWGPAGARWLRHEKAGQELHTYAKAAKKAGTRIRVFINSMSDTFEDHPALTEAREWLFTRLEEIGGYGCVDCLLLTKRPENVVRMVPKSWLEAWPAWVWIGTTVESQEWADRRIPELLNIPARVRFLSCEPLLGPVDLSDCTCGGAWRIPNTKTTGPCGQGIDWVICGGESGPKARPMQPDWARSLRDQCKAAGVPFLFKQWGEWSPVSHPQDADEVVAAFNTWPKGRWLDRDGSAEHRSWDTVMMDRVGKKAAGRLLDGAEHNEFPEPAP